MIFFKMYRIKNLSKKKLKNLDIIFWKSLPKKHFRTKIGQNFLKNVSQQKILKNLFGKRFWKPYFDKSFCRNLRTLKFETKFTQKKRKPKRNIFLKKLRTKNSKKNHRGFCQISPWLGQLVGGRLAGEVNCAGAPARLPRGPRPRASVFPQAASRRELARPPLVMVWTIDGGAPLTSRLRL